MISRQLEFDDSARATLERRALELAAPPASESEAMRDVVVLSSAGESYAIDAPSVLEVVDPGRIARVPGAGAPWAGLANIRGTLLPVLDLALSLGLASGDQVLRRLLVIEARGVRIGLLVDRVTEIRRVPESALLPPPTARALVATDVVLATTADMTSLLDIDRLLAIVSGNQLTKDSGE